MVGSLSSGSSGPRPIISSRISATKSFELLRVERHALGQRCIGRRAAGSARRISSSGSFSSAERLISSISRRCSRTLASSSLSRSSGLTAPARRSARASAAPERRSAGSAPSTGGSDGGVRARHGAGAAARRAVKRPAMRRSAFRSAVEACRTCAASASDSASFFARPAPRRRRLALSGLRQHQLR